MKSETKEQNLRKYIKDLQSTVVAFSGGIDSTLVLKIAFDELGKDNVLAVIGRSASYPKREMKAAKDIALNLGINYRIIDTEELNDQNYTENPKNRCFYCKSDLFSKLKTIAQEKSFAHMLDGSNSDDVNDHRPGKEAANNMNILSPLQECGFTKDEIRALAKRLKLTNWNKPAMACLASRFPYGQNISQDGLLKVEKAEYYLQDLGLTQVRVRLDSGCARIEVLPEEFHLITENNETITNYFRELGFIYISLDLDGYRTGSLNVHRSPFTVHPKPITNNIDKRTYDKPTTNQEVSNG